MAGLEEGCASISGRLAAADTSMQKFTLRAEALREQRTQLGKHADQVYEALALSSRHTSCSEVLNIFAAINRNCFCRRCVSSSYVGVGQFLVRHNR